MLELTYLPHLVTLFGTLDCTGLSTGLLGGRPTLFGTLAYTGLLGGNSNTFGTLDYIGPDTVVYTGLLGESTFSGY